MIGQANHRTNHRRWYITRSDPAKVGGRNSKQDQICERSLQNKDTGISFFPVKYQDPTFPLQAARGCQSETRHELVILECIIFYPLFSSEINARNRIV